MSSLGISDRLTLVTAGAYFKDRRKEYNTDGNVVYEGVSLVSNAETSDSEWHIWRYTYDSSGNRIREEGPLDGSWDGRASLDWDANSDVIVSDLIQDNESAQIGLMEKVLSQLKIINSQLLLLTNTEIEGGELE
jgi:YD repeat-containing protein